MTFRITVAKEAQCGDTQKLIFYLGRRRARIRDGFNDRKFYWAEVNGKQWRNFNAWLKKRGLGDGPFAVQRVPD